MPTVTGVNVPGWSKDQHIGVWSGYFGNFDSSGYTVSFGGKRRTVRWVDKDAGQLGVLDESHGEVEVLNTQAKHLGIMQIEVTYDKVKKNVRAITGSGRNKKTTMTEVEVIEITGIQLGALRAVTGGKSHTYEFMGKLV